MKIIIGRVVQFSVRPIKNLRKRFDESRNDLKPRRKKLARLSFCRERIGGTRRKI